MSAPVPPGAEIVPQTPYEWFFFAMCMADLERHGLPQSPQAEQQRIARCERLARHFWPLVHYKIHGIPQGRQWAVLGRLAARYARDFPVSVLADVLREVMEASPQDRRKPWTRSHATDIAVRAHRFIEREDAAEAAWMPGLMRWCERYAQPGPRTRHPRRTPGARERRQRGRAR